MISLRAALFPVALVLIFAATSRASQTPQGTPLGALSVSGEVYLDNVRVSEGATVYTGETLHTGADGAARITIIGRGALTVAADSAVSFAPQPRYFAQLLQGSVGWRPFAGAENFQLRFGNFTVVPFQQQEATAAVELAADGSAQVSCSAGTVGVIELEGTQVLFLNPGQVATVSAKGELQSVRAGQTAPEATGPPGTAPKPAAQNSRAKMYVWIGIGGGGVAVAAAVLASGHGGSQPVESPSKP